MASKNHRIQIVLDIPLYNWLKEQTKAAGISFSLAIRDILKKAFEEQAWFWTEKWQKGEKEADLDIKSGRISKAYSTAEEFLKDLKDEA
ncbi:MAG: hypothetical protein ABIH00_05285 [Armatimonadota bacterium]